MKSTLIASSFIASALAATHEVTIGPGLSYSPDTVTAAQGDIVAFKFGSGHDVVSGSFGSPCQPDGNIYSGEANEGDVFSVTINSTDPIWIYCSVPHHCQGGMAMVINAPSDHTVNDYKTAAQGTDSSSQPNSIVGGVFGNAAAASSSNSSSAASSTGSSGASSTSSATSSASGSGSSSASSTASRSASASTSSSSSGAGAVGVGAGLLGMAGLLALL